MIIYSGAKQDFMDEVVNDTIAYTVRDNILTKMHRTTGKAEFNSWINSLQYMFKVLCDTEIPNDAGVAIEYNVPNTSKRIDFLISGYGDCGDGNVVIVELKQWNAIEKVDGLDALVNTFTGGSMRRVVHPSYQAWSYAAMIRDYNEAAQIKDVHLWPCAYLHNYLRVENDPIDDSIYQEYIDEAPVFAMGDVQKLREFIRNQIKAGDNAETIYEIDNGRIKPSKSLQDAIAGMLKGNDEFNLIDDQKVIFERTLELARMCRDDGQKRTLIIQGGPGTGKTVVAINLLAQLTQEGMFVQYTSKNSAPRTVYGAKLKGHVRKTSVDLMFKGSGAYVDAPADSVDVILADEAHRLNEKSGLYNNAGINQIFEIIHASKLSVFFLDESQRVTLKDIGSKTEIEKWAEVEKSLVYECELASQFRCNGSDGYLAWLDDVLEIKETANYEVGSNYEFMVLDSPADVYEKVVERNRTANKSRLLAGYCWDWPRETRKDSNFHDIKIEEFEISWNLDGGEAFAIGETSVNEAGCIHTTQGLEFDYVGVIVGDDMRFENGKIVTDFSKRAKTDQSIKGLKKLAASDPEKASAIGDEIIKNTYRTLMTRGMKGCYVFCTDPLLREYLKNRLF